MADIGVKMGVTGIAQFKTAMQQGTQSVKTLDAALKKNEAQYKATGDAEAYMQQKTKLLEQQIKAQKSVCDEAEKALETMTKQGVDPASKAYQQMQQQLLNAQTALLNMQNDLSGVGSSAKGAADGAQEMNTQLKQIGKQVDFQGVLTGIDKITDGMEKAAKSVINFAGNLWDTMKDAASWADDNITLSQMYGISVEDLQRMQKTAEIIDTPVEAIIKARQKLSMGLSGGFSADQMEVLGALGLVQQGKYGAQVKSYQNAIDMLWDVGAALDAMGDSIDRDAYAQQLFGRSWMELQPMFKAGRQAYDDTMNSWDVVAEENVKNLGTLDDSMKTLEGEFQTLKLTVLSELAPAFNELAGGLTDVLKQVNEYLQSDEGKEKLQALGEAVTRLFENITNIDTGELIGKVSGALDSVTKSLDWIWENKDGIVSAIKAIAGAFIALKAVEVAGSLAMGANALKNLLGGGAAGGAAAAAGAEGAALTAATKVALNPAMLASSFPMAAKIAGAALSKPGLLSLGILTGIPLYENIKNGELQKNLTWTPEALANVPHVNPLTYSTTSADVRKMDSLLADLANGRSLGDFSFMESMAAGLVEALQKDIEEERNNIPDLTYGGPYNLPGSTTPNEEMQASWDAIVAGLDTTADEIETGGDDAAAALENLAQRVNSINFSVPGVGSPFNWLFPDAYEGSYANGLPWVPHDGIAMIHRGERIVPASQNRSYTANNNLYVDRMYMNNGTDADALAARIAEQSRRTMSGFGG